MNVNGSTEAVEAKNVVPLFSTIDLSRVSDPLEELTRESNIDNELPVVKAQSVRLLAHEGQFPDQSMYILDHQIASLRERMDRLKFYLDDLDDLLPH